MKMGRRLRCSSVTYRFRYAPSSRPAAAGPTAHFDRNESHVIYGTGHCLRRSDIFIGSAYNWVYSAKRRPGQNALSFNGCFCENFPL